MKRGIIETTNKKSDSSDIDALRKKWFWDFKIIFSVFILLAMQTKEINKISIKPVVHLALESHEI